MKKIEKITPQNENFATWYTDVIKNGDLMSYGTSKGSIIFKPLSFGIWDNIRNNLDKLFKKHDVKNVYLPLLIPESLLQKEKDHLKGFNPELATITEVGNKKLNEKFYVRPTSETLFGEFFKSELDLYNELPLIFNQWANVVRWEKTTNPFLRTREFLWQEGHTIHKTEEEARKLTLDILKLYKNFLKDYLAIPVVDGQKTEHEKFSGAVDTFTIEAMMKDGKALQAATSHFLGQNFTKVFNVTYKNENNKLVNPYGTSWGTTTRLIGALIMTHGDDRGIIIPPKIAPTQIDIIELFSNKEPNVSKISNKIEQLLSEKFNVLVDRSNKNPGFKAANSEIHGTPLRIEIGPNDVKNEQVIFIRRDTLEKKIVKLENVLNEVIETLDSIQENLYDMALSRLKNNFIFVKNYDEFKENIKLNKWVVTLFDGDEEDEVKIKDETGASTRCIPFDLPIEVNGNECFYTKKRTKKIVIFAKAY